MHNPVTFDAQFDAHRLRELAAKGIYIGTSSWKYQGWLHQVYNNRGYYRTFKGEKVLNQSKFGNDCLSEFTNVFPTVCNDSAYYRLPEINSLEKLAKQVPPSFKMAFKIPEQITLREERKFVENNRGISGKNPTYLNPKVFLDEVLKPIQDVFGNRMGVLIFEFSPFFFDKSWGASDYTHEHFVNDLGNFLHAISKEDVEYAVETRDTILIADGYDDYLEMLRSMNVSNVINAQTWKDPIEQQIKRLGIITANFIVVRALTPTGLKHQDAVQRFEPYSTTQNPMPELRKTIAKLMIQVEQNGQQLFAYINNRTEGNAPNTIHAILDLYDEMKGIYRDDFVPTPIVNEEPLDLFG